MSNYVTYIENGENKTALYEKCDYDFTDNIYSFFKSKESDESIEIHKNDIVELGIVINTGNGRKYISTSKENISDLDMIAPDAHKHNDLIDPNSNEANKIPVERDEDGTYSTNNVYQAKYPRGSVITIENNGIVVKTFILRENSWLLTSVVGTGE